LGEFPGGLCRGISPAATGYRRRMASLSCLAAMAQLLVALAYLLPALILLAALLCRRYPGERVLLRAI
jgi:hypothetical protein